jgi:release factor glutamine methyltransferase
LGNFEENQGSTQNSALSKVSGLALWQWRQEARQSAVAADVPVEEVDWLLQDVAGLGLVITAPGVLQRAQFN